ncbi:acyltransferase family protein [Luteococcus sp. OSA5]|uniref:acyltransferase family protein n=1 Tax=Luteococcus sp. OSA5 TaxID=3401630 RepID=UPI003B42DB3E
MQAHGEHHRHRPEIHGLRGLAILLVVVYHVWVHRVSGGVDVFLFISAFLLTGTFIRRLDRGEPIRPFDYWARTFKRLLPPAAVVVLLTLVGVWQFLPRLQWLEATRHALGSLFQVQNWVLEHEATDYYAINVLASPFQHFWSLSIQGQIFLLWPLLHALAGLLSRRLKVPHKPVQAVIFGLVLCTSLGWSIHQTATNQQSAYFSTFTRLWEFAAGSMLALGIARLESLWGPGRRRHVGLRVVLGWVGLLGLLSVGALVDVRGAFPGWVAILPLTAASLVIVAADTRHRWGADRLLSSRPFSFLGDISYALYLVHWPLLVIWLGTQEHSAAGTWDGLALVVTSLVLAWVLTRLVDQPVRRSAWLRQRTWASATVAVLALALAAGPTLWAKNRLEEHAARLEQAAAQKNPGARVLLPGHQEVAPDDSAPVLPLPENLAQNWHMLPEECPKGMVPEDPEGLQNCHMTPNQDQQDRPLLVVVGSSHATQLAGAIQPLAERHNWRMVSVTRRSCYFAPGQPTAKDCAEHNDRLDAWLDEVKPDALFTLTTLVPHGQMEVLQPGTEENIARQRARGGRFIAVRAHPRLPGNPNECEADPSKTEQDCTYRLADNMPSKRPDQELLRGAGAKDVYGLDLSQQMCPEGVCRPIVGNVRVFMDYTHVTRLYAGTMEPFVDQQLKDAGWRW